MGTISLSDLYGANVAHSQQAGPNAQAPDAKPIGPGGNPSGNAPAWSWIALVATLVAARIVWEYAS